MIPTAQFAAWFLRLFAEIMGVADTPNGYILETGKSGLFGTLSTISAAAASHIAPPGHATIAGHTGHILFLVQYFAAYERGETPAADWEGSWKQSEVNEAEWQALRDELQTSYDNLVTRLQARQEWPESAVSASMMLLAHCAYHVGEIRQRLLWVDPERGRGRTKR